MAGLVAIAIFVIAAVVLLFFFAMTDAPSRKHRRLGGVGVGVTTALVLLVMAAALGVMCRSSASARREFAEAEAG